MIVKKIWRAVWKDRSSFDGGGRHRTIKWRREGWFLFGVVPLYIRDAEPRPTKHEIEHDRNN